MQKTKILFGVALCILLLQAALLPAGASYDFDDPHVCLPDGHVVSVAAGVPSQHVNDEMWLELWYPAGSKVGNDCSPSSSPFIHLHFMKHPVSNSPVSFVFATFADPSSQHDKLELVISADGTTVGSSMQYVAVEAGVAYVHGVPQFIP